MSFGMLSRVDTGYHVLDWGADAPTALLGECMAIKSIGYWGLAKRVNYAITVG